MNTDISQGSVVAQLRCGGIVNEDFVANLLMNLSVNFENQSTFGEVMGKIIVPCFLTHSVHLASSTNYAKCNKLSNKQTITCPQKLQ